MNGFWMKSEAMRTNCMNGEAGMVAANLWWLRARSCWARIARLGRAQPRRLRLTETLPLGERRFVAVLEFDGIRFLLGGTASSLVLLARLESETEGVREAHAMEAGKL